MGSVASIGVLQNVTKRENFVLGTYRSVQETIRKIFPIIVALTTDEPICKVSLLIEPRLANRRVAINRQHIFTFAIEHCGPTAGSL